jgi:hypothetical protein
MGPLPAISVRSQDPSTAMAPVLSCQWVEEEYSQYVQSYFLTQSTDLIVACELTFCIWLRLRE